MASKQWCFTINNPKEEDVIEPVLCHYLIVGKEVGSEGTPHHQGYAWFNKPQSLRQLKAINGRAHWEKAKGTPYQNKVYCSKDGEYQEWGTIPVAPGPSHKKKPTDETYAEVLNQETFAEAVQIIKQKRPRDWVMHGETIERNLRRHKTQAITAKHTNFLQQPLSLTKNYLLCGPSNTGKTQYALSHFKNPLFCSHIDKLKEISPDNDGIIFDDMSFKHWPAEAVIHLLDTDVERQINVRYGTVTIPANIIKIFTHNTENPFYLETIPIEQQEAIERRFERRIIHNKLYS